MKGLEIGQTYLNRHAAKTFVHFIAQSLRNELKKAYETAKFLAVMSDGSTDSAVEEQEIVCHFGTGGKVYTQFLAVQTVQKADAQTISLAIDSAVSSTLDQNWKDQLAAIGTNGAAVMVGKNTGVVKRLKGDSDYIIGVHFMNHRLELVFKDADGAAVMVGKNTGVVKRLKGDSDYITGVHCMNHRLELAFKDATGKNPCHKGLTEELLLGLYLFYKNSALNRAKPEGKLWDFGTTSTDTNQSGRNPLVVTSPDCPYALLEGLQGYYSTPGTGTKFLFLSVCVQ